MKQTLLVLIVAGTATDHGQIFTQNAIEGSVTITPSGLKGSNNSGTFNNNAAIGPNALLSNTSGNFNTANGFESLCSNTTGSCNSANGAYSLSNNTTGLSNTANGYFALGNNNNGIIQST
jgi:hypothetical protein